MSEIPPPPPAGMNYIAAIQISLTFIMLVTPLGAILIPIIVMLFVFSTPTSRSQWVFQLNVLACCLGIAEAIINAVLEVRVMLDPLTSQPQSIFTAVTTLAVLSPLLVDSVLLTRVLAFYPAPTSGHLDRLKVIAFPLLVKCGRFITVVLYLNAQSEWTKNLGNVTLVGQATWYRNPYLTTEWTLQVIDNGYCSLFFLYKLRLFTQQGVSGWVLRRRSIMSRLRGVFIIALGNFVFPIILNLAQIFFISTDHSFLHGTYVLLTNNFISIIGVVFATVWTSSRSWHDAHGTAGVNGSTWNQNPSSIVFADSNRPGYVSRNSKLTTIQFPLSSSPQLGFDSSNASNINIDEADKNVELKMIQNNAGTALTKDQSYDDALATSESQIDHHGYAI